MLLAFILMSGFILMSSLHWRGGSVRFLPCALVPATLLQAVAFRRDDCVERIMFCDDAVVVVPKLAEAKHPVACPLQWLPALLAFGSLPMR